MEVFVFARDEDHALELLGNGACAEFESLADAEASSSPDEVGQGWDIIRVLVEVAKRAPER